MYVLASDNQWINSFHNNTATPPSPPSSLTVDFMVSHGLVAVLGSQFPDSSLPLWSVWALSLMVCGSKGLGRFITQV